MTADAIIRGRASTGAVVRALTGLVALLAYAPLWFAFPSHHDVDL